MVERDEFHLFGNELEETRVLIVSQSTTFDGCSSFERVSYEVQQFIRPSSQIGKNEETVDKTEYYSERESFKGALKRQKVFYKDYQYKRKIPKTSNADSEEGKEWKDECITVKRTRKEGSMNGLSPKDNASLSSFIQQRKDRKFSYVEWKSNLQKNITGWNFVDTSEYDIYAQSSNDGLGQNILARTEIDRIDRDLKELESKIEFLESTFQNLEQNIRRNWLVLHGVFEKDSNEDTLEVLINVIKEKTGLEINPQDVENCHRMGRRRYRNKSDPTKMQQNKRPIVIKFMNYCKRKDLWDHKKHLRGSGLLLTESLTTQRLELLQIAREKFGEKSVWSQDGRILYRRPDGSKIRINKTDDLNKISSIV